MANQTKSAFDADGLKKTIEDLKEEIKLVYTRDAVPWVVGYSGGKDSTAALQLIWLAVSELPIEQRTKPVHVISTDTLVENPIVAAWVAKSLEQMDQAATESDMPIEPHRLMPELKNTFWVNLIGRGYPAPRHKFRWCTERLKISPSNKFIMDVVRTSGESILVLGTRKAESQTRAAQMTKHERHRVEDRLSPNASLPNCLVYTPIEDWNNDDVWLYLMQTKNPWGYNNKDLLTMYQGASPDGECPLVVDTSTPSCGDSRFGCWVCTLVEEDRSMSAMIQNDQEKEWMQPLLNLRNELDTKNDRHLRDFRRMSGNVELFHDRVIPGPYKQTAREDWLRKVLTAEHTAAQHAPADLGDLKLISMDELHEIRRIWVIDKHELEDNLPRIYQEVTGEEFPGNHIDSSTVFGPEEMELLNDSCQGDPIHYELVRELLHIEQRYQTKANRAGLFADLEKAIKRGFYQDEDDALERATAHKNAVESAHQEIMLEIESPYIKRVQEDKVTEPVPNLFNGTTTNGSTP